MKKWYFLILLCAEEILQIVSKSFGWGIPNRGISFGLFQSLPQVVVILIIILLLVVFRKLNGVNWRLILVGGMANLISRLLLGSVWDYIPVPFINLWFNGADIMIVGGVILTLIYGN